MLWPIRSPQGREGTFQNWMAGRASTRVVEVKEMEGLKYGVEETVEIDCLWRKKAVITT
jgi:hypothetical protein